jgi:hypothetical protein
VSDTIREYRTDDHDAVVELALRAWTPVFASMRAVVGDEIDGLLHSDDWRAYQRRSVEETLVNDAMRIWVAEHDDDDDGHAIVAFVAVTLHGHAPARRTYEKAGYTALPTVQFLKAL